jgi:hypothetical protein
VVANYEFKRNAYAICHGAICDVLHSREVEFGCHNESQGGGLCGVKQQFPDSFKFSKLVTGVTAAVVLSWETTANSIL